MAGEKRIIDIAGILEDYESGLIFHMEFPEVLRQAPTVNAVEVIRCGECMYWKPYKPGVYCRGECLHYYGMGESTAPNDYCSKGKERRVENAR